MNFQPTVKLSNLRHALGFAVGSYGKESVFLCLEEKFVLNRWPIEAQTLS